jgi:hypothetical protein
MQADLELKTRQSFWETPKAIAIIVATTAAIFSAAAGFAGYKFGQTPPSLPPQIIFQPGSIQVLPPPPARP